MKFACPNCKTRYSIADEKLPTGASVKFRCKICGTNIRLKRKAEKAKQQPSPSEPEELPGERAESTRVAPLGQLQELRRRAAEEEQQRPATPAAAQFAPEPMNESMASTAVVSLNQLNELRNQSSRAPSEPAEWYVLISGEQKGPVSLSAVRDMLQRQEISHRTFVWMNGMADWKRLGEVAPLRELAAAPESPGSGESTAMMDVSTLQEHIAAAKAEPAQPVSMFDERTATMDARELEAQVAEMRAKTASAAAASTATPSTGEPSAPGDMFNDSTAMMDVNTLQQHIAAAKEERAASESQPSSARETADDFDVDFNDGFDDDFNEPAGLQSGFDNGAFASREQGSAGFADEKKPVREMGDDDATTAEPARERMQADMPTLPGVPESQAALGSDPTLAAQGAELEPDSTPFSREITSEQSFPDIEPPTDNRDEAGFRVDTDEAQAPSQFHKARTMVQPLGDIAAAVDLAGEPTGERMGRDDISSPGEAMSQESSDPFGSLDAPFGGPRDVDDELESHREAFNEQEELRPLPGGEYHDAPPGEQTRVFMATAGIFKRRRNNFISAVIGVLVVLLLGGVIALDVMGIYTIPGMGLAYDLTGLEDPNKSRAIERTRSKLQTASDPAERKRLQNKLLGLGAAPPPKKGKGAGGKSGGKTGEIVTEGIKEDSDLSDEKKSLAGSLFGDDRKSSDKPSLKAPEEISTADLPDGLTQDAIQKVIKEKQSSMKLCLTEAARKGEKLSGRMEVQITIDATGKVIEAAINTEQYKGSSMGQCTVKRVMTWKFPRFNGEPVTVVFPYVLTLGL